MFKVFKNDKNIKISLILFSLIVGYFVGNLNLEDILNFKNFFSKVTFQKIKGVFEFVYYVMASLLIPIAYVQYRHENKIEKKGAVEYAHQLFRYYSETILILDEIYDQTTLAKLSLASPPEDIKKFNVLLNKLDTFAAAFNFDIADLRTGKKMMGNTYCQQVNTYLPTIKRISGENYRDGIENLFELFEKWKVADV